MKIVREETELTHAERFVRDALAAGAIRFPPGGFELKGGRMSPYFFDIGAFSSNRALKRLSLAYAFRIEGMGLPEIVYGPPYKGIQLATAISFALGEDHGCGPGPEIGIASHRKEPKKHAEKGVLLGAPVKGKRVIVVDDVMTTGSSSGEAIQIIRAHGGNPVGCVIGLDRQERWSEESSLSAMQQFREQHEISVVAVATLADLVAFLKKDYAENPRLNGEAGKRLDTILRYQERYGAA
ncbi:MAG: orotate phosphoribosyltransferase [Patescibacteria group bacterium]|nr:orotate phosphoribosyltransferase [Patescibacteria group bacterium]